MLEFAKESVTTVGNQGMFQGTVGNPSPTIREGDIVALAGRGGLVRKLNGLRKGGRGRKYFD